MRFLRSTLLALAISAATLIAAAPLSAQNYTTNILLQHLLNGSGPVPYANVCATPADRYGNPIAFSAPTWGFVLPSTPFCGQAVNGIIASGINVPDAVHTYATGAIYYNISIQVTNSTGVPNGSPLQLQAVQNITGAVWSLDTYSPAVSSAATPAGALVGGSTVPPSCVAPSLFVDSTDGSVWACRGGTYSMVSGTGAGLSSFVSGNLTPLFSTTLGGAPTSNPSLAFTLTAAAANRVFAGPASGADAAPSYRALVAADIPALAYDPTGTATAVLAAVTPYSIGAAPLPTLPTAPLTDLHFSETSGTTLFDTSGNHNDCAIQAGNAPALSLAGATFQMGNGCDLPAAVNAAHTVCASMNIGALPPTTNYPGNYYGLVTSSTGSSGLNLMLSYGGAQTGGQFANDVMAPMIFNSGNFVTTTNVPYSGPNITCWVAGTSGTSLDHIYVNGIERDSYFSQGASGGTQTSGHLSIGSSQAAPWVGQGLPGVTLYEFLAFTGELSAAQVKTVQASMIASMTLRGVSLTPPTSILTGKQLIFLGDSITAGYALTDPSTVWTNHLVPLLTNSTSYTTRNFGLSGVTALAIQGQEPYRVGPYCQTAAGPSLVTLWEATNDLHNLAQVSPPLAYFNNVGVLQRLSVAGCRVILATILSRTTTGYPGANFDTDRDIANNLILTQGKLDGAYGISDQAAIPCLGKDGSNTSSCFAADNTHPSDLAEPYIAATWANSINYYTGSTAASPYVASTSRTLPSSARFTDATGCASACAFTLPDATGPTGEEYTIITGASTVTVQGITIYGYTQTVSGSSGAVTLPANATSHLRIVRNPPTVGGVRWVL